MRLSSLVLVVIAIVATSVVPSLLNAVDDYRKAPVPPFYLTSKVDIEAGYLSKYPPVSFRDGYIFGDSKGRLQYIIGDSCWMSVSVDGSDIKSAPVLDGNTALVGTIAGTLASIHMLSGESRWAFKAKNAIIGRPLVAEDNVYFGSADERFYCLNLEDGSKVFEYQTNAPIWSTPCVVGDSVIFGGDDDSVYCINRFDGELIWVFKCDGWVEAEPVVDDTYIYIGTLGGSVYKIDILTGELEWKIQLNDAVHSKGVQIDNKYFIADDSGSITCLDTSNGEIIWQRTDYSAIDTPLETNGELIYFTDEDKRFVCLDIFGDQLWRRDMIHAVRSGVLVDENTLVMVSSDGFLEYWDECGYVEVTPKDRYLGEVAEEDGFFSFRMDIASGRKDGRASPGMIDYRPFEAGKRCKSVQFKELSVSYIENRRVFSYEGRIDLSDPSFCDGSNDFVVYFGIGQPLSEGDGIYQSPSSDGMVHTRFTFDLVSDRSDCQTCEPCYKVSITPSNTPYFKRNESGSFEIQVSSADDINREIEINIEGIKGIESEELKLMQEDGLVSHQIEFDCMDLPGGSYFQIPISISCMTCPRPNEKMRSDWHSNRTISFTTDPRLRIDMKPDSVDVLVNGNPVRLDVPARIVDGRTLVPIRFVAETFGCDVSWKQETKKVTIIKDETVLNYWAYQKRARFNGLDVEIDVGPIIERGRTLVPFRSVAESLGAYVRWIATSRDIIIDWEF